MTVTHEPWLVALSLIMAFQGSYVGLGLAVQVRTSTEPRRRLLLAGAALTLALAIWSMHFVGMLAARLPVLTDFLVLPTLLSFLVCVLVVGIGVFAASNRQLTPVRLGIAAFVMGAGICTMHYLGMYALHLSLSMSHDTAYVLASFLIAFNASGLALWLLFGPGRRPPMFVSAVVMALAISAMHYIAMAGLTVEPIAAPTPSLAPALNPGTLAILVSCVSFLVSGLFLLKLVPEQPLRVDEAPHFDDDLILQTVAPVSATSAEAAPRATSFSKQEQISNRTAHGLQSAASPVRSQKLTAKRMLPIEHDGQKAQIAATEIVAIHADAHYTKLFDGSREYFCPLSISEAERQLDSKAFNRVHRSHIVNLARVASFKRSGDGGLLVLQGDAGQTVPVSRSRWSRVKSQLTTMSETKTPVPDPAPAQ
jgi:NO-binding membrane sensor protein with MHYT domain